MVSDVITINPKGQITIPNLIRKVYLKGNRFVALKVTPQGILLVPVEVKEKASYTKEEWEKIEKLASGKGKVYKSSKAAKKYIDSL